MIILYIILCVLSVLFVLIIALLIYARKKESSMPDWYQKYWCAEIDDNGDIKWKENKP